LRQVFALSLSRGYNEQSFREDLKILYSRLGIENRRILFVFSDQQIIEDGLYPSSSSSLQMFSAAI